MTLARQARRGPWWPWLLVGTGWAACVPACGARPAASPEPPELADARVLVSAAGVVLPLARQTCPTLPDPAACSGVLDAVDDALAVVGPQLEACQEAETREECEAARLVELRKRLPELRRLLALAARVAGGAR